MKKNNVSRKTFWWTVLIVFLAVCVMDLALWAGLYMVGNMMAPLVTSASGLQEVTSTLKEFHRLEHYFLIFGMPASFVFFLLVLGAIRLIYRHKITQPPEKSAPGGSKKNAASESQAAIAERKMREQRLFLHLVSVLQREGRLIDFFAEELDAYDDAQIGAAVRAIHATCRRVVEKFLSLKPVIQQMEGESVSVNPGFDPGAIKLVGNVTGEPPFTGKLRHRGWQAGKLEMPTFSGSQDPCILAPAEVEIE